MGADEFWIVRDGIGIKTFPRAGSTTILATYGYGQSVEKWMKCEQRFIVIRNPWERLISAYSLLYRKRYGSIPKLLRLDDLLDHIISTPTEELDVHVRSQSAQLHGYEPSDDELVTMEWFLKNPPMKLQPGQERIHRNQTMRRPPLEFTDSKYVWWKAINIKDFELYDRAATESIRRGSKAGAIVGEDA